MLLRCPQCQYANQIEAEASKPRIVCARCASVITVEFHSNSHVPSVPDLIGEEKGFYEQANMQTTETSPLDLDSLLESSAEPRPALPTPVPPFMPQIVATPVNQASMKVETRWEGDEILDIPRASQPTVQNAVPSNDPQLKVDDLLGSSELWPVNVQLTPVTAELVEPEINAGTSGFLDSFNPFDKATEVKQQVTGEAASFVHEVPETFVGEVLPESSTEASTTATPPSVFAQDSYNFRNSTFVMATPDKGNKSRMVKVFLAVGLLCALLAIGWYALSGLVKNWLNLRRTGEVATVQPNPTQSVAANAGKPGVAPSTIPSLGSKPGETTNKNASPAASASVTISPAAGTAAKPTPTAAVAQNNPAAKPAEPAKPTPVAQTGNSGHAVGAGEGSLTVQIAAFTELGPAQQTVARLKNSGVEARLVKAEVPGKGTWYRVQVGRYTSESEATKYGGELRAKGAARDFIVTGYQAQ